MIYYYYYYYYSVEWNGNHLYYFRIPLSQSNSDIFKTTLQAERLGMESLLWILGVDQYPFHGGHVRRAHETLMFVRLWSRLN